MSNDDYQNKENVENASMGCMIIAIFLVCLSAMATYVYRHMTAPSEEETNIKTSQSLSLPKLFTDTIIQLTPEQWTEHMEALNNNRIALNENRQLVNELYADINQLKQEQQELQYTIKNLQKELNQLKSSPSKSSQTSNVPKVVQKKSSNKTLSIDKYRPDAIIIAGYEHDLASPKARFSIRNNIDVPISNCTIRISYYDMKGNREAYRDVECNMTIEPNIARIIEIEGYEWKNNYVYHKSKTAAQGKPYKVDFTLMSYTHK